jgi:ABC-type anion transport system duplicated permease subunit
MDDFWLPLGISKPFYYIVLSVLLQWTTFDYPLVSSNLSITSIEEGQTIQCNRKARRYQGIIKSRPLKKDRKYKYLLAFLLHCIVCPSSMDDFWLSLGISKSFYYIVLSVLQKIQCNKKAWRYQGIIKSRPLKKDRQYNVIVHCLSFNGRLLITPWYLQTFLLHCIVCPSSMDDFWLLLGIFKPFYYIVLSVLL